MLNPKYFVIIVALLDKRYCFGLRLVYSGIANGVQTCHYGSTIGSAMNTQATFLVYAAFVFTASNSSCVYLHEYLKDERSMQLLLHRRCDEYNHVKVHYIKLYKYSLLNTIRAFPSEGRTTWVRRYNNLASFLMRTLLPVPPGTHKVRTLNPTNQMTRQARFPMQNAIPRTGRAASLVYLRRLESPST
jgi:hypothetical protein